MENSELRRLIFRNFPMGQVSSILAEDLSSDLPTGERNIPVDFARILRGVYNDKGALRHIGAPVAHIPNSQGEIGFLTKFSSPVGGEVYVFLRKLAGTWHVRSVTGDLVTYATLHTLSLNIDPLNFDMVQAKDRLLFAYTNEPLQVWYGTGTSGDAGLPTIASSDEWLQPEYEPATPGVMPSFAGQPKYRALYVFEDSHGNLSNPSLSTPYDNAIDNPGGQGFRWVGQHTYGGTYLTDNDIVLAHIFRIGGTNSQFKLSRTFEPAIGSGGGGYPVGIIVDADTGLPPYDITPDDELPSVFPSESRLPPPNGFNKLCWHQNCLFAFGKSGDSTVMEGLGSPARLWKSRYNEPEAFGNDNNGADDDGGWLDIDDDTSDELRDMASTGSVLILGRKASVYALFGSGFRTFRFDRRADHGVASEKAMQRLVNEVYYVGSNARVYRVDDANERHISEPVDDILSSVDEEDLRRCVTWAHDHRFYLSIPSASPVVLCYDTRGDGCWIDLSYDEFKVNYATSILPVGESKSSLFLARTGASGTHRMNEAADAAYNWAISIVPYLIRLGDFQSGRVIGLFMEGQLTTDVGNPLELNVTCEAQSEDFTIGVGPGRLLFVSRAPANLSGEFIDVAISGVLRSGYISRLVVSYLPLRSLHR